MAKISPEARKIIYERDGYKCLQCEDTDNLTIDHIVPTSMGGRNVMDNYQTLCRSCNQMKGNKIRDLRGIRILAKIDLPEDVKKSRVFTKIKKSIVADTPNVIYVSEKHFHNKEKILHQQYLNGKKIISSTWGIEICTDNFHESEN